MVLSDGLLYFLKINIFFCRIHQNYIVAFTVLFKMFYFTLSIDLI